MKALVYIEHRDSTIRTVSLEALSAARSVADEVCALAVGMDSGLELVGTYGASVAFNVATSGAYSPEYQARALFEAASSAGCDVVLIGATPKGKELAPLVAVLLEAAFLSEVTALENDNGLVAQRPLYGGKLNSLFRASQFPVVVTTRPKMFKPVENPCDVAVEAFTVSDSPPAKAEVQEFHSSGSGKIDLTEADIIVSGGRGMKSPDNFPILEDLAGALGGAVGASRAAVDAGWREHPDQVGQTGKVVSPDVYFACGISGAIQHLAGMSTSKVIIAINKDPDAPIFKVADYGIVGDAMKVVPVLTEEIKKLKE